MSCCDLRCCQNTIEHGKPQKLFIAVGLSVHLSIEVGITPSVSFLLLVDRLVVTDGGDQRPSLVGCSAGQGRAV